MRREPRAYLWDVREAADNILEFTRGVHIESYLDDLMLRSAVELARESRAIFTGKPEICRDLKFSTATQDSTPQVKNFHRNLEFYAASQKSTPQLKIICRNSRIYAAT